MATMKRQVAIAILALVGLLVLILVVVGTYGYQRYYVPLLRPLMYVTASEKLEQALRNTSPFQAPDSGVLTPEQWARFCDVETAVEAVVGEKMGVMARQRESLMAASDTQTGSVSFLVALAAFREFGPVYLTAKQAQVDAMNKTGLSKDEYRWVRRQVMLGAGLPFSQLDLDGMRTAAQDRRDKVDVKTTAPDPAAATANGALVSGRRAQLESWLAMAFFDL